ncbi:MAG: NADPH:quinone oxidoreductase, partial [Rhodobacterales bacterium CG15_BIG_FIL_POST_REV_8_21_14_020_59_13]
MKAVVCKEFAPYQQLSIEDVEDPKAEAGHVVIDVKAAGVNFPDILLVEGKYQMKPPLPF